MQFLYTRLDASWKQSLGDKSSYEDGEAVYKAIASAMLELDPIHVQRTGVIEMAPQNGEHMSLSIKTLNESGNLAELKI